MPFKDGGGSGWKGIEEGIVDRRTLMRTALGLAAGASLPLPGRPAGLTRVAEAAELGTAQPFDLGSLTRRAKALSEAPWRSRAGELPDRLRGLGYDKHRAIRYAPDQALWGDTDLPFRTQFFHLGSFFETPVHIYVVEGGEAREVLYDPALFAFGEEAWPEGPPTGLPEDLGFAGFRLHTPINNPDVFDELIVFLGASYFRAVGAGMAYGLSARGLAVDTGEPTGEEFPEFVEFYLEQPRPDAAEMVVYALLDSPRVTGAYRFAVTPGDTTVSDVEAWIYPRERVAKLGIAPLTSMYFFGPNDRAGVDDFRPRVHDSEGLALWTGAGQQIWRPLVNPARLRFSYYADSDPRGFGLVQRTRAFDEYQDLEARYDRRPSLWVEPQDGWGRGAVELVEIPTDAEINDNIVAYWLPERPIEGGAELRFAYKLHWCWTPPIDRPPLGRAVRTMVGGGGVPGTESDGDGRKFVVEFEGGPLDDLAADDPIPATVTVLRARITDPITQYNPVTGGRRVFFDMRPDGNGPVELWCRIERDGTPLTETWSYQWTA